MALVAARRNDAWSSHSRTRGWVDYSAIVDVALPLVWKNYCPKIGTSEDQYLTLQVEEMSGMVPCRFSVRTGKSHTSPCGITLSLLGGRGPSVSLLTLSIYTVTLSLS